MILKSETEKQTFLKDCFSSSGRTFNQSENLGFGNTHSQSYRLHYKVLKMSLFTSKDKERKSTTQYGYNTLKKNMKSYYLDQKSLKP